jgi:hypothetical protein
MVRIRTIAALSLSIAACVGCGTLASPGSGDHDLPSNRTGPFRELAMSEMGGRTCAAVDFLGLIDEPSALRLADGRIALYTSREHDGMRTLARLVMRAPGQQETEPSDVLTATLPWQGGGVASPDVTARTDGSLVMAYASVSGAIGLAQSRDGVAWSPLPSPTLEAVAAAGETTPLRAPSVVARGEGVVLVYASAGAIWMARAQRLEGPFERVDGDPTTARRDPVLAARGLSVNPDGGAPGFESGSLDDPDLSLEHNALGRDLWRIYYTARSAPVAMDGGLAPALTISMAASFDGLTFTRFGTPVLSSRADPTIAAPSMLVDDSRRTLLYAGGRCTLSRGRRGIRAAIAPSGDTIAVSP